MSDRNPFTIAARGSSKKAKDTILSTPELSNANEKTELQPITGPCFFRKPTWHWPAVCHSFTKTVQNFSFIVTRHVTRIRCFFFNVLSSRIYLFLEGSEPTKRISVFGIKVDVQKGTSFWTCVNCAKPFRTQEEAKTHFKETAKLPDVEEFKKLGETDTQAAVDYARNFPHWYHNFLMF